jgi:hypothetical protein
VSVTDLLDMVPSAVAVMDSFFCDATAMPAGSA